MEKIISEDKRRKCKILKENCCPIRSQLTTRNKKKLGWLSLHKNWTRTFVLRAFHSIIALVCRALKPFLSFCSLSTPPLNNGHINQWYPTLDLDDEGRRFFLPDVTVVDVGKCFPPVIGGVKSGSGLRFAASSLRGLPRFFFSCKHQH